MMTEETKYAICNKHQKPVDEVLPAQCNRTCSDFGNGKPCPDFEAVTAEEMKNRWRV